MSIMDLRDPLFPEQKRLEKSVHFGSQNAWYHYKKFDIYDDDNVIRWCRIEVFPTAENMTAPHSSPHYVFTVKKQKTNEKKKTKTHRG